MRRGCLRRKGKDSAGKDGKKERVAGGERHINGARGEGREKMARKGGMGRERRDEGSGGGPREREARDEESGRRAVGEGCVGTGRGKRHHSAHNSVFSKSLPGKCFLFPPPRPGRGAAPMEQWRSVNGYPVTGDSLRPGRGDGTAGAEIRREPGCLFEIFKSECVYKHRCRYETQETVDFARKNDCKDYTDMRQYV